MICLKQGLLVGPEREKERDTDQCRLHHLPPSHFFVFKPIRIHEDLDTSATKLIMYVFLSWKRSLDIRLKLDI